MQDLIYNYRIRLIGYVNARKKNNNLLIYNKLSKLSPEICGFNNRFLDSILYRIKDIVNASLFTTI